MSRFNVAPDGFLSIARMMAFLLPARAPVAPSVVCDRFLDLAVLLALAASCGAVAGARFCMAAQIRATAVLRSMNCLTGFRPSIGSLFQTSASRKTGHSTVSNPCGNRTGTGRPPGSWSVRRGAGVSTILSADVI